VGVRIFGRVADADGWTLHATARVHVRVASQPDELPPLDVVRGRCAVEVDGDAHDARMRRLGADFGPGFRVVRRLWRGTGEALAEVALPPGLANDAGGYHLHPALLDGCLQPIVALVGGDDGVPVPVGIEALETFRRPRGPVWSWMRVQERPGSVRADVLVRDGAGELVAALHGVTFRPARPAEATSVGATTAAHYEMTWRPAPRPASVPASAGRWLLLADAGGVAEKLALALSASGHRVTVAPTPVDRPAVEALLAGAATPGSPWSGIVHLASLDATVAERADAETVRASAVGVCASVLDLAQGLARAGITSRLWLVTRGAQATGRDEALSVVQAPLWGFGRVVALEHPELRPTLVDLDPSASADVVGALVAELGAADGEEQVALRGAERLVARLHSGPRRDEAPPEAQTSLRLDIRERGVLDNLAWVPAPAAPVGAGRVRIQVRAVGLNFRDILNVLGMYPGDPGPLGNECVGEVVAVGAGVQGLAVGDRVMAVADGAFATTVVTDAALAVRVPASLETEAAATVPIAFLTARYALREIAALAPGQRVLIHAAAGGVGLAAVQIARQAGAEICATAGSPDKRALLASLGIGHVLDSRSLDFADEVLARTRGEGVDVVLNSLSGEFIPRSLAVLRRGGCFVEIGRRGIWSAADVAAVRPDARYHVLYLGDSFTREPMRIQSMLAAIAAELEAGSLTALPHRVYPATRAVDAFRFMAQARHVGKIVVTPPAGTRSTLPVRGDATYLVTGGLGALGLHTAEWLAAQGARSLVLMGRSGPSPEAGAAVDSLEARGVVVRIASGDVARAADVERVLAEARETLPPIRGIVHAAGVVEDAVLAHQTRAGLAAVMAPKVAGAWNLHRTMDGLDLDFVVFYSSIAAVLGSPGQANYAAANAFLDALAAYRRGQGQPAIAVQWGPWSGGGMAARLGERDRERWTAKGVGALVPREGLAMLGRLLASGSAAPAQAAIVPIDWARYAGALPAAPALLADLRPALATAVAAGDRPQRPRLQQLLDEAPAARKRHLVLSHVLEQVAKVLQLPPSQAVDADRGLKDMGLDSLMAVELRNRLQASLGRSLPTTLAFDQPTASAITEYLLRDLLGLEDASAAGERAAADDHALADEVRALTDDEAASLLLDELARGGRESQGMGRG
jgi:NADPH:quinone reductase-like Zn-dependent oxidoreductase/NADP-dependent 3-hydroxy acid dehydrogenase YdfG/acyl carrier protein